jgi:hypothetical protein
MDGQSLSRALGFLAKSMRPSGKGILVLTDPPEKDYSFPAMTAQEKINCMGITIFFLLSVIAFLISHLLNL